jgi:hypothetical protein
MTRSVDLKGMVQIHVMDDNGCALRPLWADPTHENASYRLMLDIIRHIMAGFCCALQLRMLYRRLCQLGEGSRGLGNQPDLPAFRDRREEVYKEQSAKGGKQGGNKVAAAVCVCVFGNLHPRFCHDRLPLTDHVIPSFPNIYPGLSPQIMSSTASLG